MNREAIKAAVREHYAGRVRAGVCCALSSSGGQECCASSAEGTRAVEVDDIPSYGCGTPFDHDTFHGVNVVVDLGAGPGRDAIFAARAVAPTGRVIGVDMTPEMVERARVAAARAGVENAEFRLGDIEAVPVADSTADVVISNCVLNLVPDKRRALAEAFRILRPGGRLVVNDILARTRLPQAVRADLRAWSACVSGAITKSEYRWALETVGFVDIGITPNGEGVPAYPTYSARVTARKPSRQAQRSLLHSTATISPTGQTIYEAEEEGGSGFCVPCAAPVGGAVAGGLIVRILRKWRRRPA